MKDYENIANNIIKKIYPYLITDLKNYYKKSIANKIIAELGTGPGHVLEELLRHRHFFRNAFKSKNKKFHS